MLYKVCFNNINTLILGNNMSNKTFTFLSKKISKKKIIELLRSIYEHSPWVPERLFSNEVNEDLNLKNKETTKKMEAKKIVITGSATRIGAAIAKSLAGYDVKIILHYNKSEKEVKKLKAELENFGSEVFLIKADLSKITQTKKIIPFAYKKMKGLDCLINNASIFEKDDLSNFNEKSFNNHLNVNLKAPAILTQDFKKYLKSNKGNIVNIIDQRIFNLTPFFMSYTISKSGLQTLTKTMAMRLGPNIKVNGIAPGPIIKSKRQTNRHFKNQVKSTLLKKSVDLEDICNAAELLIENNSITGQIIAVDSGQNLSWNRKNEKE